MRLNREQANNSLQKKYRNKFLLIDQVALFKWICVFKIRSQSIGLGAYSFLKFCSKELCLSNNICPHM